MDLNSLIITICLSLGVTFWIGSFLAYEIANINYARTLARTNKAQAATTTPEPFPIAMSHKDIALLYLSPDLRAEFTKYWEALEGASPLIESESLTTDSLSLLIDKGGMPPELGHKIRKKPRKLPNRYQPTASHRQTP